MSRPHLPSDYNQPRSHLVDSPDGILFSHIYAFSIVVDTLIYGKRNQIVGLGILAVIAYDPIVGAAREIKGRLD